MTDRYPDLPPSGEQGPAPQGGGWPYANYARAPAPGEPTMAPGSGGWPYASHDRFAAPDGRTMAPGSGPAPPPGVVEQRKGLSLRNPIMWIVALAVVPVLVFAIIFTAQSVLNAGVTSGPPSTAPTNPDPDESDPPASSGTDDSAADDSGTGDSGTGTDNSGGRSVSTLPPVRAAEALPQEDREALGSIIDIRASDLRYNEGDFLGETYYRCLFSVELENLTEEAQKFQMEFQVPHVPDRRWEGNAHTLEAAEERTELVLGWETTSPQDLGITEAECAGEIELTTLALEN